MTISCNLCNQSFSSVIIHNDVALNEISVELTQHLKDRHQSEAKLLIKDHLMLMQGGLWYLLFSRYGKWEEEPFIKNEFDKLSVKLVEILGIAQMGETNAKAQVS